MSESARTNSDNTARRRPDDLLFTEQVADEYNLKPATLRFWRHADQGPASFTLGRRGRVVYRRSEVERWLAEQEAATRRGGVNDA